MYWSDRMGAGEWPRPDELPIADNVKLDVAYLLLLAVNKPWAMLDAALKAFEPGFQISRHQPATQVREEIAP